MLKFLLGLSNQQVTKTMVSRNLRDYTFPNKNFFPLIAFEELLVQKQNFSSSIGGQK